MPSAAAGSESRWAAWSPSGAWSNLSTGPSPAGPACARSSSAEGGDVLGPQLSAPDGIRTRGLHLDRVTGTARLPYRCTSPGLTDQDRASADQTEERGAVRCQPATEVGAALRSGTWTRTRRRGLTARSFAINGHRIAPGYHTARPPWSCSVPPARAVARYPAVPAGPRALPTCSGGGIRTRVFRIMSPGWNLSSHPALCAFPVYWRWPALQA